MRIVCNLLGARGSCLGKVRHRPSRTLKGRSDLENECERDPKTKLGRWWWKWVVGIGSAAGLALILAILAGVFWEKVDSSNRSELPRPHAQQLAKLERITQPKMESAIGTVRPVRETSIASRILSRIVDVRVKAGQRVQEGELLMQMDDADLQSRLQQAQSSLLTSRTLEQQAQSDLERAKNLLPSNAISRSEYDQIQARAQSSISERQRREQEVQEASIVLGYSTIRAPFGGTVVDKLVDVGDTVAPGKVLLTLYDPSHMQMVATVRESLAKRLEVGQLVPAKLESMDQQCMATISEIVPQATKGSRSFEVKVIGPCPPGAYSGMFGRISIPVDEETLLVIPKTAVLKIGQLTMVDLEIDGHLHRRSVRIGREVDSAKVELLSGLQEGQSIAIQNP